MAALCEVPIVAHEKRAEIMVASLMLTESMAFSITANFAGGPS
jgi:hypothetical protein